MGEPRKKKKPRRYSATVEDGALVLSHDAPLPDVCLKCGARDEIARRYVVFTWSPVWVRWLVFCGLGLLLRFLTRERASLVIPLCPRCNARWSVAHYASIGTVVVLVGALVAVRVIGPNQTARTVMLSAIAVIILVRFFVVRPRVLKVHRLDEEAIAFKGVDAEAEKEILAKAG